MQHGHSGPILNNDFFERDGENYYFSTPLTAKDL